ncbi:hypothetical protein D3C71_1134800 [compost metagenome]
MEVADVEVGHQGAKLGLGGVQQAPRPHAFRARADQRAGRFRQQRERNGFNLGIARNVRQQTLIRAHHGKRAINDAQMGVQRPIQHIHHLPGVVGAHGGKNRGGKPVQIDLAQVGDLPVELP